MGKLGVEKVIDLLHNPVTTIAPCQGDSLKVNFETEAGETKFVGFITNGDALIPLDASHVDAIKEHIADGTILPAVTADELVAMF